MHLKPELESSKSTKRDVFSPRATVTNSTSSKWRPFYQRDNPRLSISSATWGMRSNTSKERNPPKQEQEKMPLEFFETVRTVPKRFRKLSEKKNTERSVQNQTIGGEVSFFRSRKPSLLSDEGLSGLRGEPNFNATANSFIPRRKEPMIRGILVPDQNDKDKAISTDSLIEKLEKSMLRFVRRPHEAKRTLSDVLELVKRQKKAEGFVALQNISNLAIWKLVRILKVVDGRLAETEKQFSNCQRSLEEKSKEALEKQAELERLNSKNEIYFKSEEMRLQMAKKPPNWVVKKACLQKESSNYKEALVKAEQDIMELRNKIEAQKEISKEEVKTMETRKGYEKKIRQLESTLERFFVEAQGMKEIILKEKEASLKLKKVILGLEENLKVAGDEKEEIRNRENFYRENMHMMAEDLDIHIAKVRNQTKYLTKLYGRARDSELKVSELLRKEGFVDIEEERNYGDQAKTLLDICHFLRVGNFPKNKMITKMVDGGLVEVDDEDEPVRMNPFENIVGDLTPSRPSFYYLIKPEADSFAVKSAKMAIKRDGFPNNYAFFGLLRCMLDCKFREFMIGEETYGSGKRSSFMVDFAYSWLGRFTVDQATNKLRPLLHDDYQNKEDQRVFFFHCLNLQRYNRLWEIGLAREIFKEKITKDQLLFLLTVRMLIFQGEQFPNYSPFDYVHMLSWHHCEDIFCDILSRIEPGIVSALRERVEQKAVSVKGEKKIDSYFVIKTLLEVYIANQNKQFINFRRALGGTSVKFQRFKEVLEEFYPHCSELEKASLYRDCCYQKSEEGKKDPGVTAEAFFVVASDRGFFTDYIQIGRKHNPARRVRFNQKAEEILGAADSIVESLSKNIASSFLKEFAILMETCRDFGIERYLDESVEFERMLKTQFKVNAGQKVGSKSVYFLALTSIMHGFEAVAYHYYLTVQKRIMSVSPITREDFILSDKAMDFIKGFQQAAEVARKSIVFVRLSEEVNLREKVRNIQRFVRKRQARRKNSGTLETGTSKPIESARII